MSKRYSRLLLLVLAALMLAVSAAGAAEFAVTVSPEYQNIHMGDAAVYDMTVKNNLETTENFEIYSPDVLWDVSTIPASDKLMTIPGGASKTTKLQLKPLYVNPGRYGVVVNTRISGKDMLIKSYVMVGVDDPNPPPGEYLPSIRSSVEVDELVDPRENITIVLGLENLNTRNNEKLDIKFRSHTINSEYETSLGPLEEKQVTVNVPVDPLTRPQEDILRVTIFTTAGERAYQHEAMPIEFEIMHYGGLEEETDYEKSFLKRTKTIKLTNVGNGDIIDVYTLKKNFFEKIFTSSEPDWKNFEEDGEKLSGWTVNLKPYQSMTITVVVNYRIPFGILCAAVLVVLLYYLLRSPIIVHKSATVLATKEGGISELKVLIVVKNRTGKAVKDVSVIDKVPHIANVSKDFEMGTLHPSKVLKHEKKGTLIKWEVEELDRFEERVLAYKIKSKLSVLGDFKLPVAVVRFASKTGKERSTHSNSVTLVGA